MKFFKLLGILFLGIFLFFESSEYKLYKTNIEIEKSPIYIEANIEGLEVFKGYESRRGNKYDDSLIIKYSFKTNNGIFGGETNSGLTKDNALKYINQGYIEVVYLSTNPNINTVKTYFKEGETKKLFFQYSVSIAIVSFIISLILSLLLSWKFGWLKKRHKEYNKSLDDE